jgi:hypothetical protein
VLLVPGVVVDIVADPFAKDGDGDLVNVGDADLRFGAVEEMGGNLWPDQERDLDPEGAQREDAAELRVLVADHGL